MYLHRCSSCSRVVISLLFFIGGIASGETERQPPSSPADYQVIIKAGAVVVGATAISCMLIPRLRKICREVLRFRSRDNVARQDMVGELSKIDQLRLEVKDDLRLLADEMNNRRLTADEDLRSMLGRQANFNGFAFENATAEALPRLLNELFPKLQIRKIVRNVEGSYSEGASLKRLEFDTIAISDQHVFVIESKIGLKRRHIDKFVKKLDNFSIINFDDKNLNKQLLGKKIHGGLSYMFDGKWHDGDNLERVYLVSRYARDKKKLLTIFRLNSGVSDNLNLAKLHDFSRAKVKHRTSRRRGRN